MFSFLKPRRAERWAAALYAAACMGSAVPRTAVAQVVTNTSCWGRCGQPAAGSSCSCATNCLAYGNCCTDKDELCFAQTSTVVGPLVDPDTQPGAIYGTDLGLTYSFADPSNASRQEILFGDSWTSYLSGGRVLPSICVDYATLGPAHDDAYATIPFARDPASLPSSRTPGPNARAPQPVFETDPANGNKFKPITLYMDGGDLFPLTSGWAKTPTAPFNVGTRPFAFFNMDTFTTADATGCPATVNGGATGFAIELQGGVNVCADNSSSQSTQGRDRVMKLELGYRPTPSNETRYVSAASFLTNKFINPTIAIDQASDTLYMWGRPFWQSVDSTSRARLYLLKHSLSALTVSGGSVNWRPQFLTGVTGGTPQWSSSQQAAKCLYGGTASNCIVRAAGQEEFTGPGQMEIQWVAGLNKWVMLYGGDMSDKIDQIFRSDPAQISPNDEPAHGAIHIRMADKPWGPWSRPVPTLFRSQAASHLACHAKNPQLVNLIPPVVLPAQNFSEATYASQQVTGTWPQPTSPDYDLACVGGEETAPELLSWMPIECATEHLDQNQDPPQSLGRGNLYAPNIIESWTDSSPVDRGWYARAAQIFWNVSTWNPYQVILVSTRLELPIEYASYGYWRRMRSMYDNRFVANSSTSTPRVTDRSTAYNTAKSFYFGQVSSTSPTIKNGDTVYISQQSGRYLARSGNAVIYKSNTTSADTNARWKIVATNCATAGMCGPGGELIYGKTRFRLESVLSDRKSLKNNGSSRDLIVETAPTSPGNAFIWQYSWECISGDNCLN